jgi:hypothetical protein
MASTLSIPASVREPAPVPAMMMPLAPEATEAFRRWKSVPW